MLLMPRTRVDAQVVTAGEDTFINVWSLPDFESKGSSEVCYALLSRGTAAADGIFPQVSLLFSACVKDQLLTGVQFVRDGRGNIATAAYDVEQISLFVRS